MKVLVAYASKHGGTEGIAGAIASELTTRGLDAEARPVTEVEAVDGYDAIVLGSAVYMGKWMHEASVFAERQASALCKKPVWLFSSGPIGEDEDGPSISPEYIEHLWRITGAHEHRIFAGLLNRGTLGFLEKLAARASKAPEGDFRPWKDIRGWADQIAVALTAGVAAR